jgi:hypothetical protein
VAHVCCEGKNKIFINDEWRMKHDTDDLESTQQIQKYLGNTIHITEAPARHTKSATQL